MTRRELSAYMFLMLTGVSATRAQTRIDLKTQSKGLDIERHLNETGSPHTAAGVAASAKQGDGTKFQMSGGQARGGGVAVYDATGNVVAGDCSIADGTLSCGEGSRISTIELPELAANGAKAFTLHGAPVQSQDGCVVLSGQPSSGQVLRATDTTIVDDENRTCVVMEWVTTSSSITDLASLPTRRYIDLQGVPTAFPPAAHAGAHKHGGADEIATAVPAANAIPKADASGALAPDWLPGPGIGTKGGVQAADCGAAGGVVKSINSDGSVTCVQQQTGGGTADPAVVGLTMPAEFAVTGSPVHGSGTLSVSAKSQSANTILAGPSTGSAAVPTYRTLTSQDLPVLPFFQSSGNRSGAWALGGANQVRISGFFVQSPAVFGRIMFYVPSAADASGCGGSGCQYDVGVYNSSGVLLARTGPQFLTTTGVKDFAISGGGTVRLETGKYYIGFTGSGSAAQIATSTSGYLQFCDNVLAATAVGGVLPPTLTPPADTFTIMGVLPYFALR